MSYFRNGDIAIEKAGIEPNTNRMPMYDEEDDNTENEEERKVGEGNARRKKHVENDQKMKKTIMQDEKKRNNASKKPEELAHSSGSVTNERHKAGYTGGRDRQLKERHKGEFRRRQADKKMRSGMF